MPDTDLLFVYGTLCRTAGGGMHRLLGSAVFLGEAVWRGSLYLVDGYPGAVTAGDSASTVRGELYRLTEPAATLAVLDEYEECGQASAAEGEYLRSVTMVTCANGTPASAWIYLYNRPVTGLALIESGDFCKFQRGGVVMAKEKYPVTPAIRQLRAAKAQFREHLYPYEEKGGTRVSARELGVDEHAVIKTLIMEDELKNPLIVLMHGDCQVSTKELARVIGVKQVTPCAPDVADRHSGYLVGGTSPFGTKKSMPVYLEESILQLATIYLNGGKRGFLVGMEPGEVMRLLQPTLVKVAITG